MSHRETVLSVAQLLGLLDAGGALLRLESLMVLDFALALEERFGTQIPAMSLTAEAFADIDSVTRMITELLEASPNPTP